MMNLVSFLFHGQAAFYCWSTEMSFDFVLNLLFYNPKETSPDFSGGLKIHNHGKDHVFLPHWKYPVRY